MTKHVLLAILTLATVWCETGSAQALLPRPKQYVLISFDGSYSHSFWDESLGIADKTDARFSYFISGVYFLQKSKKGIYAPPRHKVGASDIGFANNDPSDLNKRVESVWYALSNGFDIGSHVNGHFDGAKWTKEDWTKEFDFFHQFVEGVFNLNDGVKAPFSPQWPARLQEAVVGFRAPLLAENLATRQVMKDFNYLYDASGQVDGKWPVQKDDGIWDLSLTRIKLAGTKRKTVAMDYNVFYGQCNAKFQKGPNGQECEGLTPRMMKYFEDQTYLSYITTFLTNYYGNRAPLSIGHHFSLWNRGVYWRALQRVIYAVCSQPEVECITHKDMVGVMQDNISKYGTSFATKMNQAAFDKQGTPQSVGKDLKIDLSILQKVAQTGEKIPEIQDATERVMLKGDLPGAHAGESLESDLGPYRIDPREGTK